MSTANKKQGIAKFLWVGAALFLSLLCLVTLITALYIDATFKKQADLALFSDTSVPCSPRFYIYSFQNRADRIGEKTEVTDSFFAQRQTAYVSMDEIPEAMKNAFVAIEDKGFWTHSGVDWKRTLAAGVNYVLGFCDTFGASTITQQLVKNMTGSNAVTWKRKLQEIIYATDLEKHLDKEEILELYLNVIHFSDNCNGICAAAEHYFSKAPMELSAAECASIAAITNHPTYYNPIHHPKNNLERRNLILKEMKEEGFLSANEYQASIQSPLALCVDSVSSAEGVNSWYVDMVIEDVISDLVREYGMSRAAATRFVYTKGISVDMAMDEEIQRYVEEYYKSAVILPKNANGEGAQSALIVIDNQTGDVLGVAGAVGEKRGNRLQNFATETLRSPGSTIKPLSVYAPALEKGLITWASVYDDVPTNFDMEGRLAWPKNANGIYRGLTNVSYAVAHSTNTVAIRVLRDLGLGESLNYLKKSFSLCTFKDLPQNAVGEAALGLGQLSDGVTLREMTGAYTAFADGGIYHAPRSYYRVLDKNGTVLLSNEDGGRRVLSEGNAAVMTKLLQGVTKEGTSGVITLQNKCECAGKTGTTTNDYDRWFIGYTPDIVCGVWCGYEYPEPLQGRNLSTGIWNRVMSGIFDRKGGNVAFEVPTNVICTEYCKDSGQCPCEICTKDPRANRIALGWFVAGTEPHWPCECHVPCPYDTEHGGVLHTELSKAKDYVGLIRVERHFPIELSVSDAQYVWRNPPSRYAVNPNENEAYFSIDLSDFCGKSDAEKQYNRSSVYQEDDWEKYTPYFFTKADRKAPLSFWSYGEYPPHRTLSPCIS